MILLLYPVDTVKAFMNVEKIGLIKLQDVNPPATATVSCFYLPENN